MIQPKASVIIPAYNKAAFTIKTVESVLAQTYKNLEIIVVDDGSTDQTRSLLAPYQDRIRYIYKENGGACSARNLGLKVASGKYIGFLDCDDLYVNDKIARSVEFLEKNPDCGFVHTGVDLIDAHDRIVGRFVYAKASRMDRLVPFLIMENFVSNPTVVVRRDCFVIVGSFDENIFTPADWDLWIRLAERYKAGFINAPLSQYRVTDNFIFNKLELSQREEIYVIEKFFQRNAHLRKGMKKKAMSASHLRYAQCYFLKNDYPRLKREFFQAFKLNPFNFKAWLFFFAFFLGKKKLKSRFHRKILHPPWSA